MILNFKMEYHFQTTKLKPFNYYIQILQIQYYLIHPFLSAKTFLFQQLKNLKNLVSVSGSSYLLLFSLIKHFQVFLFLKLLIHFDLDKIFIFLVKYYLFCLIDYLIIKYRSSKCFSYRMNSEQFLNYLFNYQNRHHMVSNQSIP